MTNDECLMTKEQVFELDRFNRMVQVHVPWRGEFTTRFALISQTRSSKIQQQTGLVIRCGKIVYELDLVGLTQTDGRLQFAEQDIVDNKISDEVTDKHVLVLYNKMFFQVDSQPSARQLKRESIPIN